MYSAGKRDSTWFPKYSPAPHFHALEAIFFFRTAMINLSHRPLEIGSSRNCFICLDRKDQGLIGLNTYMRTTPFGVEITNCGPKGSTWVDHAPMDTFQRRTLTNRATIRIGNEYGLLAFKDGYKSVIEYNKFGVPIIHPRVYEIASEDHRKLTLTESEYFRKALELYQMQMDKQVPNETDRCVTMFFQTGAKFNVKIRQIITFGAIGTLQTISSSIRRI